MRIARIYLPTKSAMQSGKGKTEKWVLEFVSQKSKYNPLMGWESSKDTNSQIKLNFSSKEQAIEYANKNNIKYKLIEPNQKKFVIKSYADNFLN
jgi:ETC complex I subunit conserved region.|tara:strand:+ start:229 stop:510 length:282 start_codon:yes stop_codon:yes gene_type:complete